MLCSTRTKKVPPAVFYYVKRHHFGFFDCCQRYVNVIQSMSNLHLEKIKELIYCPILPASNRCSQQKRVCKLHGISVQMIQHEIDRCDGVLI